MTISSAIHCSQLSTLTYVTQPGTRQRCQFLLVDSGVRRASDLALPAFLSSVAGSSSLSLQLLPARFHSSAGINDTVFTNACLIWQATSGAVVPDSFKQKAWDGPLVAVKSDDVLQAAQTQVGRARLIAAAAPHAGDYLNALPCSAVGTRLDDTSLRIAVALRLGTDICSTLVHLWPSGR